MLSIRCFYRNLHSNDPAGLCAREIALLLSDGIAAGYFEKGSWKERTIARRDTKVTMHRSELRCLETERHHRQPMFSYAIYAKQYDRRFAFPNFPTQKSLFFGRTGLSSSRNSMKLKPTFESKRFTSDTLFSYLPITRDYI